MVPAASVRRHVAPTYPASRGSAPTISAGGGESGPLGAFFDRGFAFSLVVAGGARYLPLLVRQHFWFYPSNADASVSEFPDPD